MSNVKSLIVAGAGGHGRVCADVARRSGWYVSGFCDPAYSGAYEVLGVPLLEASESDLFMDWPDETALFVAIGDNTRRLALADDAHRTGIPLAVLIDPSAVVSPSAIVKPGALVMPNATVNAEAVIGRAALVNSAAVVEHGARVDEGCMWRRGHASREMPCSVRVRCWGREQLFSLESGWLPMPS